MQKTETNYPAIDKLDNHIWRWIGWSDENKKKWNALGKDHPLQKAVNAMPLKVLFQINMEKLEIMKD